jgi:uncharacterized protein (DUF1697 family)
VKTHIALLRGINVGGHKPVGMSDLRTFLTKLGFANAQTLLQSGNLVFQSDSRTGDELERFLEQEARKRLKLEADFIVRTAGEWKKIVEANPFRKEAQRDPGHLLVMCFKSAVDPKSVETLQSAITGSERISAKGREAYIVNPDGVGRSRFTHALIEKKMGVRGTGRNWNTVLKLGNSAETP